MRGARGMPFVHVHGIAYSMGTRARPARAHPRVVVTLSTVSAIGLAAAALFLVLTNCVSSPVSRAGSSGSHRATAADVDLEAVNGALQQLQAMVQGDAELEQQCATLGHLVDYRRQSRRLGLAPAEVPVSVCVDAPLHDRAGADWITHCGLPGQECSVQPQRSCTSTGDGHCCTLKHADNRTKDDRDAQAHAAHARITLVVYDSDSVLDASVRHNFNQYGQTAHIARPFSGVGAKWSVTVCVCVCVCVFCVCTCVLHLFWILLRLNREVVELERGNGSPEPPHAVHRAP